MSKAFLILKKYGLSRFYLYLAIAIIQKCIPFRVYNLMLLENMVKFKKNAISKQKTQQDRHRKSSKRKYLNNMLNYRKKYLCREEMDVFFQDACYELNKEFLNTAFLKGDKCAAIIQNNNVISYLWISKNGGIVDLGLTVTPGEDYVYIYKAFTKLEMRGKGYFRELLAWVVKEKYESGLSFFSIVEKQNYSSVEAFRNSGFKNNGTLVLCALPFRKTILINRKLSQMPFYFQLIKSA